MTHARGDEVGRLLALLVHDLRNPLGTLSANFGYLRGAEPGDAEAIEALRDCELALAELTRALEHVAWIGRWLAGDAVLQRRGPADVARALLGVRWPDGRVRLDLETSSLVVPGGEAVARCVEILVANALDHARTGEIEVVLRTEAGALFVAVADGGAALAPELREAAFTVAGQPLLKARADGRYGRVAGLLAARILAEALGGAIEAREASGRASFELRVPLAAPTSA